jgi:hypothetical protein
MLYRNDILLEINLKLIKKDKTNEIFLFFEFLHIKRENQPIKYGTSEHRIYSLFIN